MRERSKSLSARSRIARIERRRVRSDYRRGASRVASCCRGRAASPMPDAACGLARHRTARRRSHPLAPAAVDRSRRHRERLCGRSRDRTSDRGRRERRRASMRAATCACIGARAEPVTCVRISDRRSRAALEIANAAVATSGLLRRRISMVSRARWCRGSSTAFGRCAGMHDRRCADESRARQRHRRRHIVLDANSRASLRARCADGWRVLGRAA